MNNIHTVIKHLGNRNSVRATVEVLRRDAGPFEYRDRDSLIAVEASAIAFAAKLEGAYQVTIYSTGDTL